MNSPVRQASKSNTYSLKNFSVLLVEDYEFSQQLIVGMLRAFGVGNIIVCSSGEEAQGLLSVMASSKSGDMKMADIILADWMMPEGSGEQLIKWIRNHKSDKIKFMPLILISAFTSETVVKAARDFGANEALVKPLSGEKMAMRILSVIDHPRPYIKAPTYFGPDRRRRDIVWKNEERRKMEPERIKVNNEQL
jgi:CheY-like chemotaxis protein